MMISMQPGSEVAAEPIDNRPNRPGFREDRHHDTDLEVVRVQVVKRKFHGLLVLQHVTWNAFVRLAARPDGSNRAIARGSSPSTMRASHMSNRAQNDIPPVRTVASEYGCPSVERLIGMKSPGVAARHSLQLKAVTRWFAGLGHCRPLFPPSKHHGCQRHSRQPEVVSPAQRGEEQRTDQEDRERPVTVLRRVIGGNPPQGRQSRHDRQDKPDRMDEPGINVRDRVEHGVIHEAAAQDPVERGIHGKPSP